MIKMNLGIIRYRKCVLEPPTTTKLKYPSDPAPLAGEKIWIRACMQFSQRRYLYLTPPPRPQLLKYIMLKLQVYGCIIILVYSIRFGCLWITCIYICQGFFILIEKSFGQSHDVFCFGSPRNYQQIAFTVLWQKNKEFSLAYLKIPFSHENKEQICFICIEKNNEISNFWV